MSQWIFKMSSADSHTGMETSRPLVNDIANNALWHSSPDINHTLLQLTHILHFSVVDSLLNYAPDFVCQLDFRAVLEWWMQVFHVQESWPSRVFCTLGHCPAERWRNRMRSDVCRAATLCWKHITIVCPIDRNSRSTNIKSVRPRFDMLTDTISDWLNVERVQTRRFAAMSFFLVAAGKYRRSFCEFFGVANVNNFSSVNHMKQTSLVEYVFSSCFDQLSLARLHSAVAHGEFRPRSRCMIRTTEDWERPVALDIWQCALRPATAILKTMVSQGSVFTRLRCGEICNHYIVANLLLSPMVKKTLKIGQHLAKLRPRVECPVFVCLFVWLTGYFSYHVY